MTEISVAADFQPNLTMEIPKILRSVERGPLEVILSAAIYAATVAHWKFTVAEIWCDDTLCSLHSLVSVNQEQITVTPANFDGSLTSNARQVSKIVVKLR